MSAGMGVLDQVRQAVEDAHAEGLPTPGRPTLVNLTGATEHQVRSALATLADPGGPLAISTTSAGDDGNLAGRASTSNKADAELIDPRDWRTAGDGLVTTGETLAPAITTAGEPVTSPSPAVARTQPGGGKFVAWVGFAFGSIVSVCANILAARIPPDGASADWHPSVYAQVGAAVWPVALLLSVEVLSRVQWPSGWGWRLARYGGWGRLTRVTISPSAPAPPQRPDELARLRPHEDARRPHVGRCLARCRTGRVRAASRSRDQRAVFLTTAGLNAIHGGAGANHDPAGDDAEGDNEYPRGEADHHDEAACVFSIERWLRAASDDGREVQSEVCRVSGLPRSWRSRARQDVGGDPAAVRLPAGLHP